MNKIDIRDLRVGNWVYYGPNVFIEDEYEPTKDVEIIQIQNGVEIEFAIEECYIPIPLTREILEKNFEDTYNGSRIYEESDCRFYLISLPDGKTVPALLSPGDGTPFLKIADIHHVRCYYVHQLQNILRDLGIDKEIVL